MGYLSNDHNFHATFNGPRPTITVLCGSTRFYDEFQQANYDLTMAGYIVLSVGFYPHAKAEHGHGEGVGHDSAEKIRLDGLHKRKIDLADEVLVLNVATPGSPEGYIGDSTRSEIEYARSLGKPIRYLVGNEAANANAEVADAMRAMLFQLDTVSEYHGHDRPAVMSGRELPPNSQRLPVTMRGLLTDAALLTDPASVVFAVGLLAAQSTLAGPVPVSFVDGIAADIAGRLIRDTPIDLWNLHILDARFPYLARPSEAGHDLH